METVTITKKVKAQQYIPGEGAPDGCVRAQVEVHWAHGRDLVYFTFAHLRPQHWMGVEKILETPVPEGQNLEGYSEFWDTKIDVPKWYRKVLPFAFWSVKSEAQISRDHSAVFADMSDPVMLDLIKDYISLSEWVKSLKDQEMLESTLEFRETDGALGRGYRPYYLTPGDWLVSEKVDGKITYRVMTDEAFQKIRQGD